jgi:hypothetical protein
MKPAAFTSFAGVRNTLEAERLHVMPTRDNATTDLVEAVNVDIDNSGQVARRSGIAVVNAGACHSLWSGASRCSCAAPRCTGCSRTSPAPHWPLA